MAERLNIITDEMNTGFALDAEVMAPPPAPLDMPRQTLERSERASGLDFLTRLFLRNA